MKSLKENRRGITLVSLVITIVVLLILASITTYSGVEVIKSSRLTTFTTEMKIMQTQLNELYKRYKNGDNKVIELGKKLDSVSEQANKAFNASGITEQSGYRYFDQNTIKNLKIEGVEGEFFVNIQTRSVVSYEGLQYEGETYYTLDQLPNGLYNVEYNDKNINEDKPTFDTSVEKISEGKWKVTVSNIQYEGYIDKWQVNYQLEGKDYWNTSEDLSFIVNEQGNYLIKIVNGNVESEGKKKQIGIYVEDGLLLRYDGILNTRSGNNPYTTSWEDLSGNNNDGQFINSNGNVRYLSQEQGYEFTDKYDYIKSMNKLNLSSDPDVTLEFVYKWYGDRSHSGIFHIGSSSTGRALFNYIQNGTIGLSAYNVNVSRNKVPDINKKYNISFVKKAGNFNYTTAFIYENGILCSNNSSSNADMNLEDTEIYIGRNNQGNNSLNGIIYAVRVYDRALTDEEIQHNYEIDKVRFNIE